MAKSSATQTTSTNGGVIFTPQITLKNGRVIYAADYGLKAFCFTPRSPKPKQ